jgi:hypothetical protein
MVVVTNQAELVRLQEMLMVMRKKGICRTAGQGSYGWIGR